MTRLSEIERYKGIRFLVKFVNPEYLDTLLDGKLFMNTLGHFIEQEEKTKIRGQGDKYEGAHVFPVQNIQLIDRKTDQVFGTAKTGIYLERYEGIREIPVFCFTNFTAKDFKLIKEEENSATFILDIDDEEKNKILENFGSKAVLLPSDFIEMLEEDSNNQNLQFIIRSVLYDDYTVINPERMKKFEENPIEVITWKERFFEYQREVRFAINHPTQKPIEFKMRNIREQSVVMDAEKFLKEYYVEVKFNQQTC
ncbi:MULTISPECIES: hypothetical protein [Peribacillus]|uniref:hypothetical protein n=1 Tax=Peribacillus TaxID=2675229 RepID=UPI001F4D5309|nr:MULTISPECIES: hypothetical protein [unclassified Peribacillus]MCK1983706.1 hypothetical protein [Peribacillus sp. Aquil_B1]MCK2011399.1 hypothetical protein [Peribacillus sp. Aquil_B8]